MVFVIRVDIFEPAGAGADYPVVRHEFTGKTEREATGYLNAHLKTDSFLRACIARSDFRGLTCVPVVSKGWVK
jgi:hypothetical protein